MHLDVHNPIHNTNIQPFLAVECTFILLDPDLPDSPNTGCHGGGLYTINTSMSTTNPCISTMISSTNVYLLYAGMIGDVNLYWNDHDEPNTAEIEIMIAEPQSRRKGIASEALNLFMAYAIHNLGVTKFCAKIGDRNKASQQLFARLGYRQESHSDIFKEITMVLDRGKDVESDRSFDVWNRLIDIGKTQLLLDNKKCAYDTMLVPSMAETKK